MPSFQRQPEPGLPPTAIRALAGAGRLEPVNHAASYARPRRYPSTGQNVPASRTETPPVPGCPHPGRRICRRPGPALGRLPAAGPGALPLRPAVPAAILPSGVDSYSGAGDANPDAATGCDNCRPRHSDADASPDCQANDATGRISAPLAACAANSNPLPGAQRCHPSDRCSLH